jgi:hypothetical protein
VKIFLTGSKKSKKIIGASSYLVNKYIPNDFEVNYINYGNYNGEIFGAKYNKIANFRSGGIKNWGKYLANYFKNIKDDLIIFSLDDFFLSNQFDVNRFESLKKIIECDLNIANAQLSITSQQRKKKYYVENSNYFLIPQENNYSATCQWTLWRKNSLIDILENTTDPWDFEINGSTLLNNSGLKTLISDPPIMFYPTNSALSERNKDMISVFGNKEEDINELIKLDLLKSQDLILGQFPTVSIPYNGDKNQYKNLLCNSAFNKDEIDYIKYIVKYCL